MRELIHVPLIHSLQYVLETGLLQPDPSDVDFRSYDGLSSEFWSLTNSLVRTIRYPRVRIFHDGYDGETRSIKGIADAKEVLTSVYGKLANTNKFPDFEPIYALAENCDEVIMQRTEDSNLLNAMVMSLAQEKQVRDFFEFQVQAIPENEAIPDEIFLPYQNSMRTIFKNQDLAIDARDHFIRPVINETLENSLKEKGILLMGAGHRTHFGLASDISVVPLDKQHAQLAAAGAGFVRQLREHVLIVN